MYQIGMSSCGFSLTEENFRSLQEHHIDAIEISMDEALCSSINYPEVKRLADAYGITLWSYHLPFAPFEEIDPSSLDAAVRDHTVAYFTELIQKGAAIGIDKFVIHPSAEPIDDGERSDRLQYAMQTLDRLATIAAESGAVLAVEDLPRSCLGHSAGEIEQLISANPALRVCFDTNHLLCDDNLNFIRRLSDKIVTVHVSDYDFVNERHWLPGEGKLDWVAMMNAFEKIGYRGVWMYELGFSCPKTILRDRDLTCADFYENAMRLFRKETPKPVGRPKEHLGMWE